MVEFMLLFFGKTNRLNVHIRCVLLRSININSTITPNVHNDGPRSAVGNVSDCR